MPAMNPWFAKAIILVGTMVLIIIPASLHPRHGEFKDARLGLAPIRLARNLRDIHLPRHWLLPSYPGSGTRTIPREGAARKHGKNGRLHLYAACRSIDSIRANERLIATLEEAIART